MRPEGDGPLSDQSGCRLHLFHRPPVKGDELHPAVAACLFIDIQGVELDGAGAYEEFFADIRKFFSPDQEIEDLFFPLREAVARGKAVASFVFHYDQGFFRDFAPISAANGELVASDLQDVSVVDRDAAVDAAAVEIGAVPGAVVFDEKVLLPNKETGMAP